MLKTLSQIPAFARYLSGLPRFLRRQMSLADAEALIRRGFEQREANFLLLMERGVYGHPGSPYAWLLRQARCEFGDLRTLVQQRGLESTLRQLRAEGVSVSFEEMKGRVPLVRNGQTLAVTAASFRNPHLSSAYQSESGGSTGTSTRVDHDLEHLAIRSAHLLLTYHAHGSFDLPFAIWRGVLPDGSGLNNILTGAHHGRMPVNWFSPTVPGAPPPALRFRLATYGSVITGRLAGTRFPWPEMVPVDQAIRIARWAREMIETHGGCQINAPVSRALRVAVAARDAGIDLTGAVFVIAGEPATPAKVAGIRASGASCYTTYGFVEAGRVAMGCAQPVSCNDLHILTDAFAVLPFPRRVPGIDVKVEVDALNITSLLLTTPQILLNAEVDDYGVVEERRCGCPLDRFGYHHHVRDIHSFRKLTGEGVTLVGGEMIDIMERVLPARFGGSALDYQLMEEEDERGFTRLSLLVSPRVPLADENAVVETIMNELSASSVMADAARNIWAQAGTFRIQRREPVLTRHGKLFPLRLVRKGDSGASA
ncbi:MAG TPA: hypothetical protein PLF84_20975 [Bryobacteraceae bacterium]|nr:hypothetical protein [Bryobacteraceae bacterium]